MWKWAHFRVGWCGSLPYMSMRSIRIRSITERHSLFPRSYIRTPYRLALRLAYHFRRSGEIRTYHVPCKWLWWVRSVLFTGSLDVRVTPPGQEVSRLHTFLVQASDFTPWREVNNIIRLVLRNDVYQTFTLSWPYHQVLPLGRTMLSAIDLGSRFGLFLSERVLCQGSFAQNDYSLCTYPQTTANGIAGAINASLS